MAPTAPDGFMNSTRLEHKNKEEHGVHASLHPAAHPPNSHSIKHLPTSVRQPAHRAAQSTCMQTTQTPCTSYALFSAHTPRPPALLKVLSSKGAWHSREQLTPSPASSSNIAHSGESMREMGVADAAHLRSSIGVLDDLCRLDVTRLGHEVMKVGVCDTPGQVPSVHSAKTKSGT